MFVNGNNAKELSTPLGNYRWFLLPEKGTNQTPQQVSLLKTVGTLFGVTFCIVRNVYGILLWYTLLSIVHSNKITFVTDFDMMNTYVQCFVCTLTRVLNAYWTYLIYCGAVKKAPGAFARQEEKIK